MKTYLFYLAFIGLVCFPVRSECRVLAAAGKQEDIQISTWVETAKPSWENVNLKVRIKNLSSAMPHEYVVLSAFKWPLLLEAYDQDGSRIKLITKPNEYHLFFDDNFSPEGSMWSEYIQPGESVEIHIPLSEYCDTRRLSGGRLLIRWCWAYWNPPESTACIDIPLPQEPQVFEMPKEPVKANFFPKVPTKRASQIPKMPSTSDPAAEASPQAASEWPLVGCLFASVFLLVTWIVIKKRKQKQSGQKQ